MVSVGGCDVVDALGIALVVVMIDDGFDLGLKVTGQEVVFQQDAVLLCLMPPFHCPAVNCAAMSREGSCLGFVDDMVHRENASCLCPATVQPDLLRRNWIRCH